MDIRNLTGRSVVVTGAASGIGRASALAFAGRGANLEICDLDEKGLEETAESIRALGRGSAHTRRVDVAVSDEVAAWASEVNERVGAVDVLMNNAGVAIGGDFLDTPLTDWRWIVDINLMGVVHGCHHFIPRMCERGRGGHVVNVASAAGLVATSALAAYATTKFAVVGLSEALRDELHPHRIGVTAVCPGLIDTPITRAAKLLGDYGTEEARSEMIAAYERRGYGPERVAKNVLKAVQRGRGVAPIAPEAWAMYYAKRLFPGALARLARWGAARRRRQLESAAKD